MRKILKITNFKKLANAKYITKSIKTTQYFYEPDHSSIILFSQYFLAAYSSKHNNRVTFSIENGMIIHSLYMKTHFSPARHTHIPPVQDAVREATAFM